MQYEAEVLYTVPAVPTSQATRFVSSSNPKGLSVQLHSSTPTKKVPTGGGYTSVTPLWI